MACVQGQVLYNLQPRLVPLLMGTTTFAGMFPLVWIIWLPDPPPFIGTPLTVYT